MFQSGDVVIDRSCVGGSFASPFSEYLIGVVHKVDQHSLTYAVVWGDWRYEGGWVDGKHSDLDRCELAPPDVAERALVEWTAWRLTQ